MPSYPGDLLARILSHKLGQKTDALTEILRRRIVVLTDGARRLLNPQDYTRAAVWEFGAREARPGQLVPATLKGVKHGDLGFRVNKPRDYDVDHLANEWYIGATSVIVQQASRDDLLLDALRAANGPLPSGVRLTTFEVVRRPRGGWMILGSLHHPDGSPVGKWDAIDQLVHDEHANEQAHRDRGTWEAFIQSPIAHQHVSLIAMVDPHPALTGGAMEIAAFLPPGEGPRSVLSKNLIEQTCTAWRGTINALGIQDIRIHSLPEVIHPLSEVPTRLHSLEFDHASFVADFLKKGYPLAPPWEDYHREQIISVATAAAAQGTMTPNAFASLVKTVGTPANPVDQAWKEIATKHPEIARLAHMVYRLPATSAGG